MASASAEKSGGQCTVLVNYETPLQKESDFIERLESKDDEAKIEALKALISAVCGGESYPKLLMCVIKYALNTENHLLKKLLLLYWEVVEKKTKDGHLLHEMILVCNAMKNNLIHANEYIRGSTLRFLCKIKEEQILESLIPSITANLEHRHSYVRKNAVLTVFTVYESFKDLIPDAPELIERFLYAETNPSSKRNAFLMLFHCDQDKALNFLNTVIQTLSTLGESFQLVVLELIRKVCRGNPSARATYLRAIFNLVQQGQSHAVQFEGANTLVALSSAPTAVRAAIAAYTSLLQAESDNNIKLIILQRLSALKRRNEKILQEMIMDILGTLASPNIDIRRKTLELVLDLLTPRNVEEVVQMLKKELVKTEAPDYGSKSDAYRKLLMDSMHHCAIKFPDVVATVVTLLLNYLGDDNASAALDVIFFVREIVEEYPQLREFSLTKVLQQFDEIKSAEVYRVALWIAGEYATEPSLLDLALQTIRTAVGNLPFQSQKQIEEEESKKQDDSKEEKKVASTPTPVAAAKPVLLPDGTYASQSAATSAIAVVHESKSGASRGPVSHLRSLIIGGDYFLAASLTNSMTKLILRYASTAGLTTPEANEEIARGLLLFVSILRYGQSKHAVKPIDPDSFQRIGHCLKILLEGGSAQEILPAGQNREVFAAMLEDQRKKGIGALQLNGPAGAIRDKDKKDIELVKQADDLISIRQLKGKAGLDEDLVDDDDIDLTKAIGNKGVNKDATARLSRVYQLTGFSDPVYAEAHLQVQDYDIVLDILVVNQTASVLQNVTVELHTSGDLKVLERPQTFTIATGGQHRISSTIKLTSTESGTIFGNIVYDNSSGTQKTIVVLNNILLDVMDYISPATCTDMSFRSMWAEFEWENKVAVNTDIAELSDYLNHIATITNMKCMTSQATLQGHCNFLAANLYARSMFGEDALLNLSVEKQRNGKIVGYIRIRSKTQGIALSLGDKITAKQRGVLKT